MFKKGIGAGLIIAAAVVLGIGIITWDSQLSLIAAVLATSGTAFSFFSRQT